ncbi:hypothetical protein PAMP_010612 [Pampus punctatissimus]
MGDSRGKSSTGSRDCESRRPVTTSSCTEPKMYFQLCLDTLWVRLLSLLLFCSDSSVSVTKSSSL